MTLHSFPFDAGAGSDANEADHSTLHRLYRSVGVCRSDTNDSITANELSVFADSSGMQVKVRSGKAFILGHCFTSSAEEVLAIAAADPTNPRDDRVVLQLDWSNNEISLEVKTGTAAASPTPPSLTQSDGSIWEIALATIRVDAAASTIAAGKVTDTRIFSPPKIAKATGTSTATTTSTSMVDLTDMSVTVQTNGGDLMAWFSGTASNNTAAKRTIARFLLDGSNALEIPIFRSPAIDSEGGISGVAHWSGVSAGSHTVKVQWQAADGGTSSMRNDRRLVVKEDRN